MKLIRFGSRLAMSVRPGGLRIRAVLAGLAAGSLAVAAPAIAGGASPSARVTTAAPCVGAAPHSTYSHVVVVFMENHSFNQIIGSPSAPYINSLAGECGLATQYYGVTYPSLPNYLAATAGTTFGVKDDGLPKTHAFNAPSIFSQTGSAWAALSESMPTNCDANNAYPYMVKHNPAPYYTNIAAACATRNHGLGSNPTFTARYTFVTPNMQHDMHDGTIAQGDSWLQSFVPKVINSAGYQAGTTILAIVWDTDDRSSSNRAPALIVAPQVVPGTTSATVFNHYSLLRLSEETLGLPLLANAATATSMRHDFHL